MRGHNVDFNILLNQLLFVVCVTKDRKTVLIEFLVNEIRDFYATIFYDSVILSCLINRKQKLN